MEPRREPRNGEGTAPQSGDHQGAAYGASGSWGGAPGPGVEPREQDGAAPWSPGPAGVGASSGGSDNSNLGHVSAGSAPPPPPGHPGPLWFITYRRERARVLQGPGDGGTRRVSVAQVGAGGCAPCGVDLGPFSPGRPTGPKPPGLQGSHFPGADGTLGGFTAFPAASRPPSSPSATSQIPGITTSPKAPPVLASESRQEAGRARGEKAEGAGKRRRRRRHHARSFANPADTTPIPFRVRTHPTSSRFCRFIRNSPLDVPLNQTIRSKTKKTRPLWSHPSPFCHLDPSFGKSARLPSQKPVILFR